MAYYSMTKEPRTYIRQNAVSSINGYRKTGPLSYTTFKNKQQQQKIKDEIVKP